MTSKQIEAYEKSLADATSRYELPAFKQERFQDFIVNLYRKGYTLQAYNNGAVFPCVVCDDRPSVEKVKKLAKVVCCVDNYDDGFVVYPKG